MKTIPLLIVCLLITLTLQAQVSKTVFVTAGSLKTVLSPTELKTITNLTLTGTIDVRDFKTMRDDMPLLSEIDLSGVNVEEYTGSGTATFITDYKANTVPEEAFRSRISLTSVKLTSTITAIAGSSFYECSGLSSVTIPSSVTSIGGSAFLGCIRLSSIDLPSSLTSVENYVFYACTSLKSIVIPSAVSFIGSYAFAGCNSLVTVSVPSSVKSIGESAFRGCSKFASFIIPSSITIIEQGVFSDCYSLTSINIPSSVTSIGNSAFGSCVQLTSVTIPESVTSIGGGAFKYCIELTSINSNTNHPINLASSPDVFSGVNKTTCALNVPYKAKERYATANQWKDFTNILEPTKGFRLDSTIISFSVLGGSTVVNSIGNVTWTASSDQTWLTVNPTSGTGDKMLTFTAEANTTIGTRKAKVTISATGVTSQCISINQEGLPKTITIIAGGLLSGLTAEELNCITNLTITGTIDARDFKTMRDDMPLLVEIDLSGATVAAYLGTEGTSSYEQTEYPANTVPEYAFHNRNTGKGKISLTTIKLPSSITSIATWSFYGCSGLSSITIPSSVTYIGTHAFESCIRLSTIDLPSSLISIELNVFYDCTSLKSIVIPSSVTFIGISAFGNCNSLASIDLPSSLTSIETYAFHRCTSLHSIAIPSSVKSIRQRAFMGCSKLTSVTLPSSITIIGNEVFDGCSSLTSITIPSSVTSIGNGVFGGCSSLTSITIPSSVTSIGISAFWGCSSLISITIPSTVTSIGSSAFENCGGLTSVNSNASHPVNLTSSPGVFSGIDYTTCTLNVPYKAKELYANADQWKVFTNIVEATQGFLPDSTIIRFSVSGGSAVVNSTANVTWTASSNQTWLTLNPTSGTGTQAITFTAESNQTAGRRTANVTVSATNVLSQTITIIQEGLPKTITIAAGSLLSGLTADELNSITNLTITGTIDARDFKTMCDNMPSLAVLDLSGAKISTYYGPGGAYDSEFGYPENEIPNFAFFSTYYPTPSGKTNLISIVLPSSLTSIGFVAFRGCTGLTTVTIPASVNFIGASSFLDCSGLTSIFASSGVPAYIPQETWFGSGLGIDTTTCTLYVPYGTIGLYAAAPGWKDFTNIVEMAGFMVSAVEATLSATQGSSTILDITSDIKWTASSDKNWLTVSPGSGAGVQTLKFTAEANNSDTARIAKVTVSALGVESQTIIVTQEALPTGVTDLVENSAQIKCYPNPFADEITIEIRNPKRSEITVDIYNITGERITNLITGISDEQVDIVWNGTNDKGQKVAPGVYICKMNNLSKKLLLQ